MTTPNRRSGEREWLERLASSYRPAPMSAQERQRFTRRVLSRTRERGRVRTRGIGAAAVLAAAAAALAIWIAPVRSPVTTADESPQAVAILTQSSWEDEVLRARELDDYASRDWSSMLPDEYAAIESALF